MKTGYITTHRRKLYKQVENINIHRRKLYNYSRRIQENILVGIRNTEKFCIQLIHRRKLYNQTIISTRITERKLLSYHLIHGGNTPIILNSTFIRNKEGILLSYLLLHGENTPIASRNSEGILLLHQETRREYSYHTH